MGSSFRPPLPPAKTRLSGAGTTFHDLGNGKNVCLIDSVGSQANLYRAVVRTRRVQDARPPDRGERRFAQGQLAGSRTPGR